MTYSFSYTMTGKQEMSRNVEQPPERLINQLYPSTNTLVIVARSLDPTSIQRDIYTLLSCEVRDVQILDFSQFEMDRSVRVTFFDVRDAYRALLSLQGDDRFQLFLDLKGGTNRSVVMPRGSASLDSIYSSMAEFGEIEKVWFNMAIPQCDRDNVVVDFFDSRSPLSLVRKLENSMRESTTVL